MRFMTLAAFGAGLLLPGLAGAVTLTADADATIRGRFNASKTYGTLSLLTVGNSENHNADAKTYIRFDLAGLDGRIENARLELTFAAPGIDAPNFGFYVLGLPDGAGDGWDEATITGANAPANDLSDYYNTVGFPNTGAVFYDPRTVAAGDVLSHATTELDDFLNTRRGPDGLVTFVLIAYEEYPLLAFDSFASRENTHYSGPRLIFDTVPDDDGGGPADGVVPVPASLWLLGGGLAGLAGLRRRRG